MKIPIYLVEKSTGLTDSNGVKIFHTVAARLTYGKAVSDFEQLIKQGEARVRKLYATK